MTSCDAYQRHAIESLKVFGPPRRRPGTRRLSDLSNLIVHDVSAGDRSVVHVSADTDGDFDLRIVEVEKINGSDADILRSASDSNSSS